MTIIGLIPAGGKASRMFGLAKYMLPTPEGALIDVLRRRMIKAGITDIMPIFQEYPTVGAALLDMPRADTTVFAMPDTYWTDEIALEKLLVTLNKGIDVAVGVWKIRPDQRGKLGMCILRQDRLFGVIDKDPDSPLEWAWGAIAWRPYFWNLIRPEDAHLGLALNRAIEDKAEVRTVPMAGQYFDAGSPDEYFRLCSTWVQETVTHGS